MIAKAVVWVFRIAFSKIILLKTQNMGHLALFEKRDRALLSNWRPISLLNTDYKILSTRLSKVLGRLVANDQTCRVSGRTILNNTFGNNMQAKKYPCGYH